MRELEPIKITYNKTLRGILFQDFKSTGKEFPITGGWGYTKEDAIVIEKDDPAAADWQPFNFVAMEYLIAKQRIYEELIIFRTEGDKFRNVKIELRKQSLMGSSEGKSYDTLIFDVTAFHDKDFEVIEKELFKEMKTKDVNFDVFFESKKNLRFHYSPEFWFDISSVIKL